MSRLSLGLVLILALASALLVPTRGVACSTCGCGDPTLVVMGAEQPAAQLLRFSAQVRTRSDDVGQRGVDRTQYREWRLDLAAAYAPARWLVLSATLPAVTTLVTFANAAQQRATGIGDPEVRGKVFIYRDRDFAPRQLVALIGGAKFPVSPLQRDQTGRPLNVDAQISTGTLDAIFGASYAAFVNRWSFYVSATDYLPTLQRHALRPGNSLRTSVTAQWQALTWLAPRLGVDTRWDNWSRIEGERDTDSGGFVAFLSPELLWQPLSRLTLLATARLPVWNELNGRHLEGPYLGAGAIFDW